MIQRRMAHRYAMLWIFLLVVLVYASSSGTPDVYLKFLVNSGFIPLRRPLIVIVWKEFQGGHKQPRVVNEKAEGGRESKSAVGSGVMDQAVSFLSIQIGSELVGHCWLGIVLGSHFFLGGSSGPFSCSWGMREISLPVVLLIVECLLAIGGFWLIFAALGFFVMWLPFLLLAKMPKLLLLYSPCIAFVGASSFFLFSSFSSL